MSALVNDFDERAKEWDSPNKLARSAVLAAQIANQLPKGRSLTAMEFGCGTGQISFELKDLFTRVTLIDTSKGMLDVLAEKIVRAGITHFHPLYADILAEPIDLRFDVIYTSMTLHHISDVVGALKGFAVMLNPGGMLFVADLDAEDGSFHMGSDEVHHGFKRDELRAMASLVGLSDIQIETAYEMEKQDAFLKTKKYPIFLMKAIRPVAGLERDH